MTSKTFEQLVPKSDDDFAGHGTDADDGLRMYGPYRHGLRWRVKVVIGTVQQPYKSFASRAKAEAFMVDAAVSVVSHSNSLLRRVASAPSTKGGWVYVVLLDPAHPNRLKVGFTTVPRKRLAAFRTSNPAAAILGLWEASPADEDRAHDALTGRVGASEVFTVRDAPSAMARIDRAIGPRLRPLGGEPSDRPASRVTKAHATARQPAPVPNGNTAIADLVIADVRARQELGQRRYGTDLQAHNGRDALVDAYQEAIDLAMYLRQALEERDAETSTKPAPEPRRTKGRRCRIPTTL